MFLTLTVKVSSSKCVTCDSLRDTPRDTLRDTGPFLDIGRTETQDNNFSPLSSFNKTTEVNSEEVAMESTF